MKQTDPAAQCKTIKAVRQDEDPLPFAVSLTRRSALMLCMGCSLGSPAIVQATTPPKRLPADLSELVSRLALVIYRGRLAQHLWMSEELSRKLHTPGISLQPGELELLPIETADLSRPISTFLQIEDARPIMRRPSATTFPMHRGLVYVTGVRLQDYVSATRQLLGKEVILLLDGVLHHGKRTWSFPSPLFLPVEDGHWRESLPIDIERLDEVLAMAVKAGFERIL